MVELLPAWGCTPSLIVTGVVFLEVGEGVLALGLLIRGGCYGSGVDGSMGLMGDGRPAIRRRDLSRLTLGMFGFAVRCMRHVLSIDRSDVGSYVRC